jgi:hypothetical protein
MLVCIDRRENSLTLGKLGEFFNDSQTNRPLGDQITRFAFVGSLTCPGFLRMT